MTAMIGLYWRFTFLFVLSFLLVALGQPAFYPYFGALAAAGGYALFWIALQKMARRRFLVASVWFALTQLVQLSWMTSYEYVGIYILFLYLFLAFALGVQFGFLTLFLPLEKEPLSFWRIFALA